MKFCSAKNCERKAKAKNLCATHYERFKKTGDAHEDIPIRGWTSADNVVLCAIDGCERDDLITKGLCRAHYARLWRLGDVRADAPIGALRPGRGRAYNTSSHYVHITDHDHPLADKRGRVLEHRRVLFDLIGPGEHPCFHCGRTVEWLTTRHTKGSNALVVDHIDNDPTNNRPENLLPSCLACNTRSKGNHLSTVLKVVS